MDSPQQVASEIQVRIQSLFPLQGDNLKTEMESLKTVLLKNPAACALLCDEDIGATVTHLRRITGIALVNAASKKKAPAVKKVQLSKEEFDAALDDM